LYKPTAIWTLLLQKHYNFHKKPATILPWCYQEKSVVSAPNLQNSCMLMQKFLEVVVVSVMKVCSQQTPFHPVILSNGLGLVDS
jgi:hypothetical protein